MNVWGRPILSWWFLALSCAVCCQANAFQGSDMLDGTAGAHELMDRAKVRLKAGLLDEPDTTGTFSPEPSPGPDSPSQSSTSEHSQPLDTTEEVGGDLSSLVDIVAPSRSASLCHSLEVSGRPHVQWCARWIDCPPNCR